MASDRARTIRIFRAFPKTDSSVFRCRGNRAWRGSRATCKWTAPIGNIVPRAILSRTTERAREMGFTFMLGVEPEFFLIGKNADGTPSVADPADTLDKPCYGQLSLLRNADF
jgi:glutamine synthetase